MGTPTRPIPREQIRAFDLAMCTRLGLSPAEVYNINFTTMDDEARVVITASLPVDEVLAMFNTGKAPADVSETTTEYGVRYPDGHVETDWDYTRENAEEEAEATPGAVVVTRHVTTTPWTEAAPLR